MKYKLHPNEAALHPLSLFCETYLFSLELVNQKNVQAWYLSCPLTMLPTSLAKILLLAVARTPDFNMVKFNETNYVDLEMKQSVRLNDYSANGSRT